MFSYKNTKILIAFVAGLTLSVGATVLAQSSTWQGPPEGVVPPTCPAGNQGCDAPINVSSNFQTKIGPAAFLGLKSNFNLIVDEQAVINGNGTTIPLHVKGNRSDGPIYLRLENTAAPASGRNWAIFASNGGGFGFHRLGDSYNPLNFTENGEASFARQTTFNQSIRIPTGSPQAGHVLTALDSTGTATWQPSAGGGGFWAANGSEIYNTNSGNVSIGSSAAPLNAKLSVLNPQGSGHAIHVDGSLFISSGGNSQAIMLRPGSQGASYFGGNVGIGTNVPTTNLDINGTVRIRGGTPQAGYVLTALDTAGNARWQPGGGTENLPAGTSNQTLRHNGTAWVANSIIRNDGSKIGIDRDPDTSIFNFKIAVNGGLFANTLWGDNIVSTNNSLLSLQPAGRVGVGTNTPEYKLHTVGNTRIDGNVRLGQGNFPNSNPVIGEQSVNISGGLALLTGGINPEGGQTIYHPSSSTGTFWVNDSSNNRFRIFAASTAPAGTPLPKIGDKAALITQQYSSTQTRVGINLNHTSNPNATLQVGGNITQASDVRLKKDIKDLQGGLNLVQKLQGVSYKWKEPINELDKTQFGLIAQDVEKILPELVDGVGDEIKAVNYIGLIPVLIEAIKEQQDQIDELKAEVESLK